MVLPGARVCTRASKLSLHTGRPWMSNRGPSTTLPPLPRPPQFYLLVVVYIYFTRIVVYLLR